MRQTDKYKKRIDFRRTHTAARTLEANRGRRALADGILSAPTLFHKRHNVTATIVELIKTMHGRAHTCRLWSGPALVQDSIHVAQVAHNAKWKC